MDELNRVGIFPVRSQFMVAVYMTATVWSWWRHGRKTHDIQITLTPRD